MLVRHCLALPNTPWQVLPYIRYAKAEPDGIGRFLRGVIRRYVDSVLLEPYANSFDFSAGDKRCNPGAWLKDNTTMIDPKTGKRIDGMRTGIHQRKWEMDSLAAVMKVGRLYYNVTEDARPFDGRWREAIALIIHTFRAQQQPLDPTNFTSVNYTFQTLTMEPKDTSAHGIGRNHRWTGMIRTAFLPSDDSPRLPYFVPANAFAVTELLATAELLRKLGGGQPDADLAQQAEDLAHEVKAGIDQWGIVTHSTGARVYAMEVDGFGNYFFADDANVPSLIALPFFGYVDAADPVYQATRRLLLSNITNPYFYGCGHPNDGCGFLGGIGSEDASGNAGLGRVWALSLCTRLLTVAGDSAESDAERLAILETIKEASGGTGLMHESYWFEDSSVYTRFWFAMANSYLGEAILTLAESRPHILFTD
jgi:meiotically up-regulated gene 157 (Mug157) protein